VVDVLGQNEKLKMDLSYFNDTITWRAHETCIIHYSFEMLINIHYILIIVFLSITKHVYNLIYILTM
jgi:hypothetical protein